MGGRLQALSARGEAGLTEVAPVGVIPPTPTGCPQSNRRGLTDTSPARQATTNEGVYPEMSILSSLWLAASLVALAAAARFIAADLPRLPKE